MVTAKFCLYCLLNASRIHWLLFILYFGIPPSPSWTTVTIKYIFYNLLLAYLAWYEFFNFFIYEKFLLIAYNFYYYGKNQKIYLKSSWQHIGNACRESSGPTINYKVLTPFFYTLEMWPRFSFCPGLSPSVTNCDLTDTRVYLTLQWNLSWACCGTSPHLHPPHLRCHLPFSLTAFSNQGEIFFLVFL